MNLQRYIKDFAWYDGELLRAGCDRELLRARCDGELLRAGCDGEACVMKKWV